MPVWDFVQAGKAGFKLSLFLIFMAFAYSSFNGFVNDIYGVSSTLFNFIPPSMSLGCFSDAIGFTDFINDCLVLVYSALTTYVSIIVSMLTYKSILVVFSVFMRV